MRVTAVAALLLQEGFVLSVSRKNDPLDLGLPGGKIDPEDESPLAALIREGEEETGLIFKEAHAIFERVDGEHVVQTFRVTKWRGTISTRESGVVAWVRPSGLLVPACKLFRTYNRALFNHIGLELT